MPSSGPTILLVGLGHLGGVLLEFLGREAWVGRVIGCSRNRQRGEARCNLARLSCSAQGLDPQIEYRQTDLEDSDRFAELIVEVAPDLILGTATLQTWWFPELLPESSRRRLQRTKFGPWLPLHLSMTRSFMEQVRISRFAGPVLTAPFPDVVNCVLGRIGLAPTSGVGNVDEIAAKVQRLSADRLQVPLASVEVTLVAHHALEASAFGGLQGDAPPHYLQIRHDGADVTETIRAEELLFEPLPYGEGPRTAFFTAGSTMRLARALFQQGPRRIHVPSPAGLPGGYPVLVEAGQLEPAPIEGLTLDEAISINERSHPFDGIQQIGSDGTVVFMPESVAIMKEELGYDCPRLRPEEATERGRELAERFSAYAARQGVDLARFT